jgi:glycosyltransferase involved in cell wall biosynthesis
MKETPSVIQGISRQRPTVTVLMPVYNAAQYLRDAIESILNQTFRDFEFFIINDGSTDSSREIILSFQDPRIRLVDNGTNIGLTKSLNKGLKLAQGEFIARLDADDIAYPQRLSEQLSKFAAQPRLGLLGSWYDVADLMTGQVSVVRRAVDPVILRWDLLFRNQFGHSTVMFRKEACDAVGGYDEKSDLAEDYDLWSRIAKDWDIDLLPQALVRRRMVEESISIKKADAQENIAKEVSVRNLKALTQKKFSDAEYEGLYLLMDKGILPAGDRAVQENLNCLEVLLEGFADRFPVLQTRKKIVRNSIRRLLNGISPSYSLGERRRLFAFALKADSLSTMAMITGKFFVKIKSGSRKF